jgi:hypothetical protein
MDFMLANHPNSCKWVCIQERYLKMGNAGDLILQKPASSPLLQADLQILQE